MSEHYESSSEWRVAPAGRRPQQAASWRKYQAVALGAGLAAILGLLIAMFFFLNPYTTPQFVALVLHEYDASLPLRARARQDGEALRALKWSDNPDTLPSQTRELLKAELDRLEKSRSKAPLVVYLSGYVAADGNGQPYLLPVDARLDDPKRWLPLAKVFEQIAGERPDRHKLVLLDVMQPLLSPREGMLRSDAADLVWPTVKKAVEDYSRLQVFCACSPGQVSLTSEELGHSVFAYFLARGLRGRANGVLPGGPSDTRVTVRELVAYVTSGVDAWAVQNLDERQTPQIFPEDGADFPLTSVIDEPDEEASLPEAYPGWLKAGWKLQDTWWGQDVPRRSPRLYADLGAALLQAESRWRGGMDDERVRTAFEAERDRLAAGLARLPVAGKGPPVTLAQALARDPEQAKLANDEAVSELRSLAGRRDLLPKEKPDEARAKALNMAVEEFAKKFKGKPAALAWVVCRTPREHLVGAEGFLLLGEVLDTVDAPDFDEVHFLKRMVKRAKDPGVVWSSSIAQSAMLTSREAALTRTASDEAGRWLDVVLDNAAKARTAAEKSIFVGQEPWNEAAVRNALGLYRNANGDRATLEKAFQTRDEALALLPGFTGAVEVDERLAGAWRQAAKDARDLWREALETPVPNPGPDRDARLDRIRDLVEALQNGPNSLNSLRQRLEPAGFRTLLEQRKGEELTDAKIYEALLASAWPTAPQRQSLRSALRRHTQSRHAATLTAFEGGAARLAQPSRWDEKKGREKLLANDLARARRSLARLRLISRQDTDPLAAAIEHTDAKRDDYKRWRTLAESMRQAWAKAKTEAVP